MISEFERTIIDLRAMAQGLEPAGRYLLRMAADMMENQQRQIEAQRLIIKKQAIRCMNMAPEYSPELLEDARRMADLLKYYERLEEQGQMMIIPCAAGSVVFNRKAEPFKVISVEWFSKKITQLHCVSLVTGIRHTFSIGKRSLGKTVFLSREEAEAALVTDINVGHIEGGK